MTKNKEELVHDATVLADDVEDCAYTIMQNLKKNNFEDAEWATEELKRYAYDLERVMEKLRELTDDERTDA